MMGVASRAAPVARHARRSFAAHLTIWAYDFRLLASWWWLAASVVGVLAMLILTDSVIPPESRKVTTFYPVFETLVPLLVSGFFAPLFYNEQHWHIGEVRLGLPEVRLSLIGRRLLLALGMSTFAWAPAYVMASNYLGGWPLADMLAVIWLPSLTLAGLAAVSSVAGNMMASYLVPFGYWVVQYALFAMSSPLVSAHGLTLFPEWALVRYGSAWGEAMTAALQATQFGHGLLGLAALAAAVWAVSSGWAGRQWSGEGDG